jgi:two-component system nitrogen regulation response regulator GlnG
MAITRVTNQIQRHTAALRCRLRVMAGGGGGEPLEIAIPPVGVVVGADPAADVALADPAVSRRHCTIVPTDSGFEVADLGSKNGTFLDGVRLTSATVPVGAVLRVGTTLLQLMPDEVALDIPPSASSSFGALYGDSPAMRQVFAILERASAASASILFIGESGTGKELAARAVHEHSARRTGPFVVFDCGASTETLIESDLFGHRKGAFTGAVADRAGAFAQAHGGTLFLDEIGDLPLPLQPKLLRLLEAGEVTPLGAPKSERFEVRVVAATHRNLWDEVGRGAFRGDLYYRLAVVEVHLPPLRQRPSDIPELVRRFLAAHGAPAEVTPCANLDRLAAYHWPGNVRELRNVIARAVALSAPGTPFDRMPILLRAGAGAPHAEPRVQADRPFHEAKDELVGRFEREYLEDLLRRSSGSMAEAARRAGLERKYLYRLLERVGVARPRE